MPSHERKGLTPSHASRTTAYKCSQAQHQQPLLHSTRANPFPKVTGLICRLPLPAFIISDRGCSPWGPDAVMGTLRRRILSRTVFQGPPVANWTPDNTRRSATTHLFLPTSGFHRVRLDLSNRKEISAQCVPTTSPPQRASPHLHPCAGISTCFPFAGA